MDIKVITDISSINTFMAIDNDVLYVLDNHKLFSYNLLSKNITTSSYRFKQSGLSRRIVFNSKYLYVCQFCTIYEFSKTNLEKTRKWKIGKDLSSDITGVCCDEEKVYMGIRNGGFAVLDINSGKIENFNICDSSMWDMTEKDEYIYAGNVDAQLLRIRKSPFKLEDAIKAHKKNCKDVLVHDKFIYTASSDMSIKKFDLDTLTELKERKRAFPRMFSIIGIIDNMLICMSMSSKSTAFFDADTLKPLATEPIFCRNMCVYKDKIIFNDNNHIYSKIVTR